MKIAFFGSPQFALPTLDKLIESTDLEIVLVVTQPDKPAHRGMDLTPTAVKMRANEANLKVSVQIPAKGELESLGVEEIVVVAYGRMIPEEIFCNWDCINLHPSLLPKYRGPSPMQTALLNGDKETGITTMLLSKEMDVGDILLQKAFPLDINDDIEILHDKCADQGAELIVETLNSDIEKIRKKQNDDEATYCQKIEKGMGEIKKGDSKETIHNKVRSIGGWVMHNGRRVKILKTKVTPRKIISMDGTNDKEFVYLEVQPEGKAKMSYDEFKRGYGEIDL